MGSLSRVRYFTAAARDDAPAGSATACDSFSMCVMANFISSSFTVKAPVKFRLNNSAMYGNTLVVAMPSAIVRISPMSSALPVSKNKGRGAAPSA